jgi:XTP/dITP diphosphohydrolase
VAALEDFIRERKPPYMVPAHTMQIERIPLNQNQKVNRRALPRPEHETRADAATDVPAAPPNVLEQDLMGMVSELVHVSDFPITEQLSSLGLTSLSGIRLAVQLHKLFGVDIDVRELLSGATLQTVENAILKAESGCRESGLPCVADDSGLEVDALGGAPGVYSARYAGEHGNDGRNIEKLLHALRDVPQGARTARFVCTACCAFPDGTHLLARGECRGSIAFARSGDGGFGYDPVFIPDEADGRSMAMLTDTEKDAISHRRRALEALAQLLKEKREVDSIDR